MKKVVFMMSMLLTLGLFSACNNEGDVDNGMYINEDGDLVPIPIPEDGEVVKPIELPNRYLWTEESHKVALICSFFNEGLPIGTRSNSFFVGSDKDECYLINNLNELKSIYCGDKELPELDFNKYTLIIGQKVMPKVFYPVLSQELEFFDKKCELKLHVPALTAENKTDLPLYYWALYPKLKTEDISVKFVRERDAVKTVENFSGIAWNKFLPDHTIDPDGWFIYHDGHGTWAHFIYPFNLSEFIKENKIEELDTDVLFSGEVVEMTKDAREALGFIADTNHENACFIYLTKFDVIDIDYNTIIPYRGTVPFTITDMPGVLGYDWDLQAYFIAYYYDFSQIDPNFPEGDIRATTYYPKELGEEFKFNPEIERGQKVIISGNVYEDISTITMSRKAKKYKIELTKIEKAE